MNHRFLLIILLLASASGVCFGQKKKKKDAAEEQPSKPAFIESVMRDSVTGFREGEYKYFFDARVLVKGFYKNDGKNGYWEYYFYDGKKSMTGSFVNDTQHGVWMHYFENGKQASEIHYYMGQRGSRFKCFYPNGSPATEVFTRADNSDSLSVSYYRNGYVKSRIHYRGAEPDSAFYYYPTGEIKQKIIYERENVASNTMYFKDGRIFSQLIFKDGYLSQAPVTVDFSGNPLHTGDFANGNGLLITYFPPYDSSGNLAYVIQSKLNYKDAVPDGAAGYFFSDGTLEESGNYVRGIQAGVWNYGDDDDDVDGEGYGQPPADSLYKCSECVSAPADDFEYVEVMPVFPGGDKRLLQYLGSIRYPQIAMDNEIEGTVHVRFVVDKFGEVVDVEIAKGADKLLNEASLEHARRMPRWSPGMQNGVPVKVQYVFPIKFFFR